jgi:hypothetical protein
MHISGGAFGWVKICILRCEYITSVYRVPFWSRVRVEYDFHFKLFAGGGVFIAEGHGVAQELGQRGRV